MPPKTSNSSRQTRLTSTGRTKRCNNGKTQSDSVSAMEVKSPEPTLQDVMALLQSMNNSLDQSCQILSDGNASTEDQVTVEVTSKNIHETEAATTKDLMSLLLDLNRKFDDLKMDVINITTVCSGIQNEILNVKQEIKTIKQENQELKDINSSLNEKVETLEKKTDRLERQLTKKNVIFHGIGQKKKETNLECKETVCKLLTEKLKLPEDISLEDVHRVGNKPESPILVRFSSYQQRQSVLRERNKLQGTGMFISEDFPFRVRQIRRKLVPFLKEAKKAGKKAKLAYDYLIIDGQKMHFDGNGLKVQEKIGE